MMDKSDDDVFAISSMMKEVDAIIAQNMNELSPEDREKSYWAIHGISGDLRVHETPVLIAQTLSLMDQEIDNIQPKEAFDTAKSMSPEYVHNPVLRLKFLRGERFSVSAAALKFVRHFETKAHLFGTSKLVKDIEQDDLSDEDIAVLYSGYIQWSPLKDSSQRTVALMFPLFSDEAQPMPRARVAFYLRMIAMEDVDFQRNGTLIVVLADNFDSFTDLNIARWQGGVQRHGRLADALPGSTHCVHICFPRNGSYRSFLYSWVIKMLVSVLNPLWKVRVRIHRGETLEECMQSLQSFGITTAVLPKSPKDNQYQTQLLQSRRNLERKRREENNRFIDVNESEGKRETVEEFGDWVCSPTQYDVILGRGHKSNLHPGNKRLRNLVEGSKELYDKSNKTEKTEIINRLFRAIREKGRFLIESDVGWVEVTDKVAKQKVSHTFRDAGKKWKMKTKPSTEQIINSDVDKKKGPESK